MTTWYRPLLWLAVAMATLAAFCTVGAIVDQRELMGADLWFKPLKFALSVGIYAVTLSWLIGQLTRFRRIARAAGAISVVGLVIEMVIIVGGAATGETSHFNVSTPFHTALWATMAFSIVVVWMMTLVVGVILFRVDLGSRARSLAIRAGVALAIVGMGLAFLMTGPTASQLDDFQGIAGAHTVGVADGGPGLPVLGWSTVAGDLRIPHFVGMHALQAIPLFLIVVELLARRWPVLRDAARQLRLVRVAVVGYTAVLAVLTAQALAGQSIVRPDGGILIAGVVVAVGVAGALAIAVAAPARSRESAEL
jgi:hypothetical protein